MRDHDRLRELLSARHPCVNMTTFEEAHALSIVREVAMDAGLNVRLWTVTTARRDRAAAERSSAIWIAVVRAAAWRTPMDVKGTFGQRVDFVRSANGSELAVFDVHGNHCRLITAVHCVSGFPVKGRVYVLRVLTHPEYDTNRWNREL